jgi:hypothetical protein
VRCTVASHSSGMPLGRLSVLSRTVTNGKSPGTVTPYAYGSKYTARDRTSVYPLIKQKQHNARSKLHQRPRGGGDGRLSPTFRTSRRGVATFAPSVISSAVGRNVRHESYSNARSSRPLAKPKIKLLSNSTSHPSCSSSSGKPGVCDKCDGKHDTGSCPHFRKKRENHPDALRRKATGIGGGGRPEILRKGRVVSQPPDGSCLFHSMSYGLQDGSHASSLRREIMCFIERNPGT